MADAVYQGRKNAPAGQARSESENVCGELHSWRYTLVPNATKDHTSKLVELTTHSHLPNPTPVDAQPCSLLRRLGCMVYDTLIIAALLLAISALTLLARGGRPIAPEAFSFQLLLLLAVYLYFAWNWRLAGQTPGMRAWRVHIDTPGGRVGWWQTAARFAVAVLSIGLFGAGLIGSLFDSRRRTWHDRASGSRLIVRAPR